MRTKADDERYREWREAAPLVVAFLLVTMLELALFHFGKGNIQSFDNFMTAIGWVPRRVVVLNPDSPDFPWTCKTRIANREPETR